jgi:uncharacterized protein (DUF433 family)
MQDSRYRIEKNPKVLGGKPVIKGTRISVELILERIASGYSFDEIIYLSFQRKLESRR